MESIGDAWGFSGKTPITPSRGFSVETLTGVTPSWKTELNRSISTVEDRIPRGLQHHHKTCCEKGGCCGRRACIFWRCFHRGDIISRQVDLHMTTILVSGCYNTALTIQLYHSVVRLPNVPSNIVIY